MDLEGAMALQIRAELKAAGMMQSEFAEGLGLERATVNRYLQGRRSINLGTFARMADVLGVSPSVLLSRAQERLDSAT